MEIFSFCTHEKAVDVHPGGIHQHVNAAPLSTALDAAPSGEG
jgi:hypothetical protein